jgi:branched-chain amino acid transport system substrate-binding protein
MRCAILALIFAAACGRETRSPAIGFASNMGRPNAATLAARAMDGKRTEGISLRIDSGDSVLKLRSGGGLASEVDRALDFAANTDIIGVVGPGGSRQALQTAPIYRDAGIPNIIPTSTSSRLRDAGPWSFAMAADDSLQGEFIGEFAATRLGARVALVLYLPDEYGVGLASGTAAALTRRGISLLDRIPIRQATCPPRGPNPYEELAEDATRRGTADVVVLAVRTTEAACLIRAFHARAAPTRYVAGDGTLPHSSFAKLAGIGSDSLYLVAFWHPDGGAAASRAFVAQFEEVVGRTPLHDDAMFYDAVMLFSEAIRAVGPDRRRVRDYLSELGRTRPAYEGVTGPVAFSVGAPRPLVMTRLRSGRTEVVRP